LFKAKLPRIVAFVHVR